MALEHVLDSDGSVTCPRCLHEHTTALPSEPGVDHRFTCDACESRFVVRAEHLTTYTSLIEAAPLSEIPNGQ